MSAHTRSTAAFLALGLSLGLNAAARAEEPSTKKTAQTGKAPAKAPAAAPGKSSMIVVRDAETGALRLPTAEEERRLTRKLEALTPSASTEPLKVVTKPDGSKMIDLGDRFMSLSVARRGAGGKVELGCFDDPKRAAEFLLAPAPAPASNRTGSASADSQPLEEK